MIYLGIDPGTATTGFGVIKKSGTNLKKRGEQEFEIFSQWLLI